MKRDYPSIVVNQEPQDEPHVITCNKKKAKRTEANGGVKQTRESLTVKNEEEEQLSVKVEVKNCPKEEENGSARVSNTPSALPQDGNHVKVKNESEIESVVPKQEDKEPMGDNIKQEKKEEEEEDREMHVDSNENLQNVAKKEDHDNMNLEQNNTVKKEDHGNVNANVECAKEEQDEGNNRTVDPDENLEFPEEDRNEGDNDDPASSDDNADSDEDVNAGAESEKGSNRNQSSAVDNDNDGDDDDDDDDEDDERAPANAKPAIPRGSDVADAAEPFHNGSSHVASNRVENNGQVDPEETGERPIVDDFDDDSVNNILRSELDEDGMYAFCCCNCKCMENPKKLKLMTVKNNCANSSGDSRSGNNILYHRGCCHDFRELDGDFLSPMQQAIEKICQERKEPDEQKAKPISHIVSRYNQGVKEVSRFENAEWDEARDSSIYTNPACIQYCQDFQNRLKKSKTKRPFHVLDLFCGIGSGTVVLKKLKIPLNTVVHVEHDPVAVEVSKFHHKNDGIRHVYKETFEEIYGPDDDPDEELLRKAIREYGPFDLILAAAPCQNYSQVNAYKSKKKETAKYLLKVGFLIQKVNEIQRSEFNFRHNVLFLSENVVFLEDRKMRINSLEAINKCYGELDGCGLHPIQLDAKDFSPCKRNRFYWCNIPVKSSEGIKNVAAHVSADVCLDDGYMMPERVLEAEGHKENEPQAVIKANAFMASTARINDDRMIKIWQKSGKYYVHTYSVREREKMLGLPLGYVEDAVTFLFRTLETNAFLMPELTQGTSHRDFLDPSLWHFRKKCYFKFEPRYDASPFFQIKISAPREGKQKLEYFDDEGYCKHLLGNGWSLPVVEHLLEPLQDLFDKEDLQTYDEYNYSYPWEPYASYGKVKDSSPEMEV